MSLWTLLPDVLSELPASQELDELRAEEQAHQQRRRSGDQDAAGNRAGQTGRRREHQSSSRSASQTRLSPTPREPLTSTRSPDSSSSGRIAAASVASATE